MRWVELGGTDFLVPILRLTTWFDKDPNFTFWPVNRLIAPIPWPKYATSLCDGLRHSKPRKCERSCSYFLSLALIFFRWQFFMRKNPMYLEKSELAFTKFKILLLWLATFLMKKTAKLGYFSLEGFLTKRSNHNNWKGFSNLTLAFNGTTSFSRSSVLRQLIPQNLPLPDHSIYFCRYLHRDIPYILAHRPSNFGLIFFQIDGSAFARTYF